jgi:hypothetical protein
LLTPSNCAVLGALLESPTSQGHPCKPRCVDATWPQSSIQGANPWQARRRYNLIFGLIEVAAQRRSHNIALSNSRPTNQVEREMCSYLECQLNSIPRRCATFELASGNEMEREMCSYLEWQLNVNTATLPFAALYPLQRLKARFPPVKRSSGHRLFISALMCSYPERQLNIDLTTLRDFRTRVQHDFTGPGPYPPMVLPQPFDNFAALRERGRRFSCPMAGK